MKYAYTIKGLKVNVNIQGPQNDESNGKAVASVEVEELKIEHEVEGGIREQAEHMAAIGKAVLDIVREVRKPAHEQHPIDSGMFVHFLGADAEGFTFPGFPIFKNK
ncbi:hypothetical protein GZH47_33075 (plasmid) [Paenibacillus rhizovicinus]|uniref:Uncharacterized protein n=1 Tax=Paenibacillus rhizovicinus TaxID=2704463 RepID=A0A6C0PB14_9BACL|nr:hypothetical protein [Paenibacillus rhizovicinus]QHW35727.1 hypothetical protein GZH47_33075 [Paenibacillus rhizovicinus]